jgi:hypothetical protein
MIKYCKFIIYFFIAGTSHLALAKQTGADIIREENYYASQACTKILGDKDWGSFTHQINQLKLIFQKYPSFKNNDSSLVTTKIFLHDSSRLSLRYMNETLRKQMKDAGERSREIQTNLMSVRILRVLEICGDKLWENNLIFNIKTLTDTKTLAEDKKNIEFKFPNCLNEYDSNFISNFDAAVGFIPKTKNEYNPLLDKLISDHRGKCSSNIDGIEYSLLFPFHILLEMNDKDYYSNSWWIDKISEVPGRIVDAKNKLPEALAANLSEVNTAAESAARIKQIQNGNIKVAKNCGEISEALIPKEDIQSKTQGMILSKNPNQIEQRPNMKNFGGTSTIISNNNDTIITLNTNQINGERSSFVLKTDSKTVWFKQNLSTGKQLFFVGQYIGNASPSFTSGNSQFNVNARVVKLICATTL